MNGNEARHGAASGPLLPAPYSLFPQRPCRACGRAGLVAVLSLGRTPLANALLTEADLDRPEPTYPLDLVFCPHCTLVQITETVPPEVLFRNYCYFSSYSDTMLAHAGDLARRLVAERGLGPRHLVVEAASNDGYLLRAYQRAGVPVLGIEPARNVARVARDNGVPTLDEFFDRALGHQLRREGRLAHVFHAHNVLAHVADLPGFVAGVRAVLADDGVAVLEAPYLADLLANCEFDTIYHEHLCYFSLTALDRLFRAEGLAIVDVERVTIHGGSLRLFAQPKDEAHEVAKDETRQRADRRSGLVRPSSFVLRPSERVEALLAEEQAWGVERPGAYATFAARVEALRRDLRERLWGWKDAGKRLAAYGASAKGSTLLNYCGLGRDVLDFVVDKSPVKQGRYTPGSHLPIRPPEELLHRQPDAALLLAWNFADEVLAQQAEYRRRGGQFIIPVPEVRVA